MNTTKNVAIPWFKRGAIVALVISGFLLLSTSVVLAGTATSASSASASASASAGSGSTATSAAAAAAAAAAASSAGSGSTAASAAAAAAAAAASSASSASAVAVSCAASASSVLVGSTVVFSAHPAGGTGSYAYSWSGTDGLVGTSGTISHTYSTAGTKSVAVTAVSGSSSASAACSVSVVNPLPPPPPPQPNTLNGSCIANTSNAQVGDTVSWSATGVTGGIGSYTYSWTGTNGLSGIGSSVSKTYSTAGSKSATLTINSGSQHITRNCNTYISNPTPQLFTVSCSASASSILVGSSVVFTAHPAGGTGSYTYSWTGTNGLYGTGSSVSKTYSTTGSKTATVCAVSGSNCVSAACYVDVTQLPPPPPENLNGSCIANTSNAQVGDTVSWSATGVTGGTGSYTYSWSGDEGLSGNSQNVSRSYSYSGTKDATVTISSNGQSITLSCDTYINNTPYNPPYNPPVYNNLNASCIANQTSAYVGDSISWSATGVTGGTGSYTYSWSGTDGLYGNNYSAYQTYNNAGTKFAYLTVYSNGQSVTRTCSVYVNNRNYPPIYPPVYPPVTPIYGGVSLSQVPYTGLESNIKVVLFTIALIAWSALVTYIVVIRKRNKLALATVSGSGSDEAQQSARQEVLMASDNMSSRLESFARSHNAIVSSAALAAIVDVAGNDEKRAETLIASLANRHAAGTDWATLDLEKVQSAIG